MSPPSRLTTFRSPTSRVDLAGLPTYSSATGSQQVLIRASSNEVTTPLSPDLAAAVASAAVNGWRYPAPGGWDLTERLAAELGVRLEEVVVGAGSLELLDRLLFTYLTPGDEVVIGWRSYEAYPISIRVARGVPVMVPLRPDGSMNLDAMAARITARTRVVVVCSPNNPTGASTPWTDVIRFVDAVPRDVLVVVDQAYIEFTDDPGLVEASLRDVRGRGNLALLRTFSKAHGLAGFRIGHLHAPATVAHAIRTVLPPFPVSAPAVAAALWSLDNPSVMDANVLNVRQQRRQFLDLLDTWQVPFLPSQGNFVWLPLGSESSAFAARCLDAGVSVRAWADEGVRVTIGDAGLEDAISPALSGV